MSRFHSVALAVRWQNTGAVLLDAVRMCVCDFHDEEIGLPLRVGVWIPSGSAVRVRAVWVVRDFAAFSASLARLARLAGLGEVAGFTLFAIFGVFSAFMAFFAFFALFTTGSLDDFRADFPAFLADFDFSGDVEGDWAFFDFLTDFGCWETGGVSASCVTMTSSSLLDSSAGVFGTASIAFSSFHCMGSGITGLRRTHLPAELEGSAGRRADDGVFEAGQRAGMG